MKAKGIVIELHLTEYKTYTVDEIQQLFPNKVKLEDMPMLMNHIGNEELAKDIFGFAYINNRLHLNLGTIEEWIVVTPKEINYIQEVLKRDIAEWDFDTYGTITQAKMAYNLGMGIHSIRREGYDLKDVIKEKNAEYKKLLKTK